MDADDSPGSPRKKPKLGEPLPIDSVMEMSDYVKVNGGGADDSPHIPPMTDNNSKPQLREDTSGIAKHTSIPAPEESKSSSEALKAATPTGDLMADQLTKERACGITESVSSSVSGFSGVLKKRYTDFLVNEILPSGKVVHLTNLRFPKKEKHIDKPVKTVIEHVAAEPKVEDCLVNDTHDSHQADLQIPQEKQFAKDPPTAHSMILTDTKVDMPGDAEQDGEHQKPPEETKPVEVSEYRLGCSNDKLHLLLSLVLLLLKMQCHLNHLSYTARALCPDCGCFTRLHRARSFFTRGFISYF